ncbi:hypothetical protein DPSP01_003801 [Paraphaeosphaeria sporulosa]|uniref:Uncharacterized protein n=1 Tax=Paraphaeosphaeria sporulosa TaxID=1460663 RepID=A0A177CSV9_9PLEO|nr:uncharacterized protein CC84DRAFT_1235980 [Paraphaeosphaeria sporulosa]OAG09980.1 hypothetical protein CC84DRAFT_1235980 [Paraphaeosphaeria sporulosa]
MSNLSLRLPGLATIVTLTLVSMCTHVLFYKCKSDTAEHFIAVLKDRHADKNGRLLKEKHLVERRAIELGSDLNMTESTLRILCVFPSFQKGTRGWMSIAAARSSA